MNPEKNSSPSLPSLNDEAAGTQMPAVPVAGQTIEPQTANSGGSAPAPADAADEAMPPRPSAEPAAPAFEMPASPLPVVPEKRRKKGLLAGLIIAAVVLLLSGGAAAAYFGYYLPNQPENVLKRALANTLDTSKTKTVQFSGSLKATATENDTDVSGLFSGTTNLESGAFDVTSEVDALLTKVTLDTRSVDGKTFYLKVGGLDGLSALLGGMSSLGDEAAMAALYAPYLDFLNDQWFEINESIVSEMAGGGSSSTELTDAGREKLVEAYVQNEFLAVKESLPEEAISGVDSYRYKIGIDKAKLKNFLTALKNSGAEEFKLTDDELSSLNKEIDGANFDNFGLEVWISKGDKMIRQMVFTIVSDESEVEMRLTVDSYNKPVNVEKPEDAKSLLELMGGFLGGDDLPYDLPLSTTEEDYETGISL